MDVVLAHVDGMNLGPGDVVIGTLPLALAAACCAAGAEVLSLCFAIPAAARGRELSTDEMRSYGACLRRFVVIEQDLPAAVEYQERDGLIEMRMRSGA